MPEEVTIESLQGQLLAVKADAESAAARIAALKDEAKGHRLNGDTYRTKAEKAEADLAAARTEAERLKADIEKAADEKVKAADTKAAEAVAKATERAVNADLKVAAKEAGARDVADILALIDRSKLTVVDGEVANAAEIIAAMKKAKPHLFGEANSSSTQEPPRPSNSRTSVKDLTNDQWKAEIKRLGVKLG